VVNPTPPAPILTADLKIAGRLDTRFFGLLRAIAATGSISQAAKVAGLSYRGAWLILESASHLAREPLIQTQLGGRKGGGTRLTRLALLLLAEFDDLVARQEQFLAGEVERLARHPEIGPLFLRRLTLKTSARNQFSGVIRTFKPGPATTTVGLEIYGGALLTIALTQAAAEDLGLAMGQEAMALIKPEDIVLVADLGGYRLSARNQLAGTVTEIEWDGATAWVHLALPGGAILVASTKADVIEALGLTAGAAATAVFKAYAVMLAVAA
jgi:molybdate transport system regulatory protein